MMQALFFLLNAIAGFFAFLPAAAMQWLRVSFSGQLGHFVVTTTNWAVKPLRRVIPGWRGFDWASLLAAFVVQLALTVLVVILSAGESLPDALPFSCWRLCVVSCA